MKAKRRKCGGCKQSFNVESLTFVGLDAFCSPDCGAVIAIKRYSTAKSIEAKAEKKVWRDKKVAARDRSWYIKKTQEWFNRYIRLRDKLLPCICCGRDHTANIQWHAGHFLTTGARPEHRFNEDNCHKQTSYCNNHLSGNVAEYRKRLILKVGIKSVEALEQDHSPKKYTIDQLKELIETYKLKIKELSSD